MLHMQQNTGTAIHGPNSCEGARVTRIRTAHNSSRIKASIIENGGRYVKPERRLFINMGYILSHGTGTPTHSRMRTVLGRNSTVACPLVLYRKSVRT